MKFRRTLLGLAAVATALGMFSSGAMAQAAYKAEYKMSLVLGPPTPWGQAGKIWADLVKERTQGRINIKLYPGVSLIQGDQTREFSALRQGVIDMAVGNHQEISRNAVDINGRSLGIGSDERVKNQVFPVHFDVETGVSVVSDLHSLRFFCCLLAKVGF